MKFGKLLILISFFFVSAINIQTLTPETDYQSIRKLIDNELYQKAKNRCDSLLRIFPNDHRLYKLRGVIYVETDRYDLGLIEYEKGLSINPLDTLILYNRALLYYHTDQYYQSTYDQLVLEYKCPNWGELYTLKAMTLFYLDNNAAAISQMNRAVQLEPKNADYYLRRGTIYLNMDSFNKSENDLSIALSMNDSSCIIYERLSDVAYSRDNKLESINWLYKAMGCDTNRRFEFLDEISHTYYELKQYDDAIQILHECLAIDSTKANVYYGLGISTANLGQFKLALRYLDKSLSIDAKQGLAYYQRALIKQYLGDNKGYELDIKSAAVYETYCDHKLIKFPSD